MKHVVIIGAGMGGLAAGIYGQINGYETQIFEIHTKAGGQCTSWKRKGYTFDPCIHHFFGCKPGSSVNQMWHELGALPRELVNIKECTAVASLNGKMFIDYYDLEKLNETLLKLSPADSKAIKRYIGAIKIFANDKVADAIDSGSLRKMIPIFLWRPSILKWMRTNMRSYAEQFSDPFLRRAFVELIYSNPDAPFYIFPRYKGLDSEKFALDILDRGVAIAPGTSFGDYREHFRISLTAPETDLKAALIKICEAVTE